MSLSIVVVHHAVRRDAWWTALRDQGHSIVTADTPNAALDAVAGHPPDIVVLDLDAAPVNQFALARALRASLPARTSILVLSGTGQPATAQDHTAVDLVLDPPIGPAALGPILHSLQQLRRLSG